jgi:DNA mismatch endonuclease, patch repair protein
MMARFRNVSDIVSPTVRSRMMRAVKQSKTVPEIKVRRIVRAMGCWFSVHNRDLPGSPDLANRRKRWAVFVNGCFWHGHKNCRRTTSRVPRTNAGFWAKKFRDNRRRDAEACRRLRKCGYRVAIVWECALIDETAVSKGLRSIVSRSEDARA